MGPNRLEYRRVFALSDADLRGHVLGCADGPASFNVEATRCAAHRSSRLILCIDSTGDLFANALQQRTTTRRNMHEFIWDGIRSEELGRVRMEAMEAFLADYDSGKQDGRYLDAELPDLAFPDRCFDLAVCSHFLFLYWEHLWECSTGAQF